MDTTFLNLKDSSSKASSQSLKDSLGNFTDFSGNNLLSAIDRKVILKHIKDGKGWRTYIIGLDGFMTPNNLDTFTSKLKKTLGTALLKKEEDGKIMFGYSGDHRKEISEIIIKEKLVPKDKIKVQ
jgi:translation initiation factor 1 (eIF-1/SUI1)